MTPLEKIFPTPMLSTSAFCSNRKKHCEFRFVVTWILWKFSTTLYLENIHPVTSVRAYMGYATILQDFALQNISLFLILTHRQRMKIFGPHTGMFNLVVSAFSFESCMKWLDANINDWKNKSVACFITTETWKEQGLGALLFECINTVLGSRVITSCLSK